MAVKKTTVATAVSVATKASSKKAEPAPTANDWDVMLIDNNSSEDTAKGKKYVHYLGKDRLIRQAPGWGSAKGKLIEFCIYATDENGVPLEDLPEPKFGLSADVDYYKAKYPLRKGYFVNDSLCRNGRHRLTFYRIHILNVIDKPVEEIEVE